MFLDSAITDLNLHQERVSGIIDSCKEMVGSDKSMTSEQFMTLAKEIRDITAIKKHQPLDLNR